MSVPPQLIRVKRKATEEAPVSYLRVQDNKRHRSDAFVYQRQDEEATFASAPAAVQKPVIHISQPTGQDTAFQRPKRKHSSDGDTKGAPASDPSTPQSAAGTNVADASEPRRFHLKRSDAMLSASQYPTRDNEGFSRKRAAPALFVERKIKRISSRTVEKLQSAAHAQGPAISAEQDTSTPQDTLPKAEALETSKTEPPRKFKKPGVAKLASKGAEQNVKTELPKSMTNPWNIDMDRMTDEMNAFALEQIGLNLQKADEEQKQRAKPHKGGLPASQLKFKPKAPAKRYAERHPEATPELADKDKAMGDADTGVSDTDDDEYIIETYVRVPASKMGDNVLPQNVGLLVFDAEPDMEYFYGEGSDSDDEWAEDQEDENAENYYAADYPDDEVASDDEYDMNAYAYRTRNASDLEEYGTDDDDDDYKDMVYQSDDERGGFKTFVDRNGFTTNHL